MEIIKHNLQKNFTQSCVLLERYSGEYLGVFDADKCIYR